MPDFAERFAAIALRVASRRRRGRPRKGDAVMTTRERSKLAREKRNDKRRKQIAVLDMETDPFDPARETLVFPFLAVLYSDHFEPVIIWDEDWRSLVTRCLAAIEALPDNYIIYAHNGGRFDFMFLIHELRGQVKFKGRAIMQARVGNHELRDSLHIIPESLSELQKDAFDYKKMEKRKRNRFRQEIIDYCLHDCKYILSFIKSFIKEFGFKISIGAAAIHELRQCYKFEKITEYADEYLRPFYFGGRVECLQGAGHFSGGWRLYDINSSYPRAMARYAHPVGNDYRTHNGKPTDDTIFIELECLNYGALVAVDDEGKLTTRKQSGRFHTTIWEYETARKYNLIRNVKIIRCIDAPTRTNFSKFIDPLYTRRQFTKQNVKSIEPGTFQFFEAKKDDIFLKLILNNSYGKFSQNPREWKEYYITDVGGAIPEGYGEAPAFECEHYELWERPTQNYWRSFNNVGTGASITGAARAYLMEAIHLAREPIYCDTDSVICKELRGVEIDEFALGAWKLEKEIDECIIDGKKLYAYKVKGIPDTDKKRIVIRSKGATGLTWKDMLHMLNGGSVTTTNKGATLTRYGEQYYIKREIRATEKRRMIQGL